MSKEKLSAAILIKMPYGSIAAQVIKDYTGDIVSLNKDLPTFKEIDALHPKLLYFFVNYLLSSPEVKNNWNLPIPYSKYLDKCLERLNILSEKDSDLKQAMQNNNLLDFPIYAKFLSKKIIAFSNSEDYAEQGEIFSGLWVELVSEMVKIDPEQIKNVFERVRDTILHDNSLDNNIVEKLKAFINFAKEISGENKSGNKKAILEGLEMLLAYAEAKLAHKSTPKGSGQLSGSNIVSEKTRKNMYEDLTALVSHYDSKIATINSNVLTLDEFSKVSIKYIEAKSAFDTAKDYHKKCVTSLQNCAYMAERNETTGKIYTEYEAKGRVEKAYEHFEDAKREFDHIDDKRKEYELENSKLEQYQAKREVAIQAKKFIANAPEAGKSDLQSAIEYDANFRLCGDLLNKNSDLLLKEADPRELKLLGCVAAGFTIIGLFVMAGLSIHSKVTKGTWDFLAPESAKALKTAEDLNILPKPDAASQKMK